MKVKNSGYESKEIAYFPFIYADFKKYQYIQ